MTGKGNKSGPKEIPSLEKTTRNYSLLEKPRKRGKGFPVPPIPITCSVQGPHSNPVRRHSFKVPEGKKKIDCPPTEKGIPVVFSPEKRVKGGGKKKKKNGGGGLFLLAGVGPPPGDLGAGGKKEKFFKSVIGNFLGTCPPPPSGKVLRGREEKKIRGKGPSQNNGYERAVDSKRGTRGGKKQGGEIQRGGG